MNNPSPLVIADTPLFAPLQQLAATQRMVFFAGLPGVGKSLFLQQMALLAHAAGRTIHLLQWDVTRSAFETPAILARYPEIDGVTHAAIREGVGLWARGAIRQWHESHPNRTALLIGEVPLIGNRLMALVERHDDGAESLLAGEESTFVIPTPTQTVRRAIEHARAASVANPQHEKEQADALPHVMQLMWEEMFRIAQALAIAPPLADGHRPPPYDPTIYAGVYQHLLRHRRHQVLPVEQVLPKVSSVYDLPMAVHELAATPAEVAAQMAEDSGQ